MTVILRDDDIRARLNAGDAARWMGEAIDAHHRGDPIAPGGLQPDAMTVFFSVGLAGTEAFLLDRLARSLDG